MFPGSRRLDAFGTDDPGFNVKCAACIVAGSVAGLLVAAVVFLGVIEIADGRLADF